MIPAPTTAELIASNNAAKEAEQRAHEAEQMGRWA